MRKTVIGVLAVGLLTAACVRPLDPPGPSGPAGPAGPADPSTTPTEPVSSTTTEPSPVSTAPPVPVPTAPVPPETPTERPQWLEDLLDGFREAIAARLAEQAAAERGPVPEPEEADGTLTPAEHANGDEPGPGADAVAIGDACNPLGLGDDADPDDPHSCALPWPSDLFRAAEGTLAIPDSFVDADVLAEYPPGASPSEIFAGSDGFSPVGPVLFELAEPIDAASVPRDGAGVVAVYDLTAGVEVPVLVEVDPGAPQSQATESDTVLRIWPRTRWELGHRHLAVLTTALGSTGTPHARTPGVAEALAGPGTPLGDHHEPLLGVVDQGIGREAVLSLTDFTARSEGDAVGELDAMIATTDAQPHPVVIDEVTAPLGYFWCFLGIACPGIDTIVRGRVQLTDFRDGNGEIHYQPGDQGTPQEVPFVLAIPEAAADGPVPVSIYGHGLGIFKETVLAGVLANGPAGIATIAIDQPNHGERVVEGDPNRQQIFDLLEPADIARATAIPLQSQVDHASLLAAIESELGDLDVAPTPVFGDPTTGDGTPDLDVERILYEGTSLGGVLGSAFFAAHPRVDGAFIQVAGSGIMHILTGSTFWDQERACFGCTVSPNASLADAAALTAFAQHEVDSGDGSNVVHRLAGDPRPFVDVYSHGDEVVPNDASERLTALAGLPLFGPVQYEIPWLPAPQPDQPADGRGVFQIDPTSGLFGALDPHIGFLNPEPMAEFRTWLERHFFVEPVTASLTVTQATAPEGGTGFEFEVDDEAFTLDDGASRAFPALTPGPVRVAQVGAPEQWELTGLRCTVDGAGRAEIDLATGTASLDVAAGDEVVCDFTNTAIEVRPDPPATTPPGDAPPSDGDGGGDGGADGGADDDATRVEGDQADGSGSLPFTGSGLGLVVAGLILLVTGVVLATATRRRRSRTGVGRG